MSNHNLEATESWRKAGFLCKPFYGNDREDAPLHRLLQLALRASKGWFGKACCVGTCPASVPLGGSTVGLVADVIFNRRAQLCGRWMRDGVLHSDAQQTRLEAQQNCTGMQRSK